MEAMERIWSLKSQSWKECEEEDQVVEEMGRRRRLTHSWGSDGRKTRNNMWVPVATSRARRRIQVHWCQAMEGVAMEIEHEDVQQEECWGAERWLDHRSKSEFQTSHNRWKNARERAHWHHGCRRKLLQWQETECRIWCQHEHSTPWGWAQSHWQAALWESLATMPYPSPPSSLPSSTSALPPQEPPTSSPCRAPSESFLLSSSVRNPGYTTTRLDSLDLWEKWVPATFPTTHRLLLLLMSQLSLKKLKRSC